MYPKTPRLSVFGARIGRVFALLSTQITARGCTNLSVMFQNLRNSAVASLYRMSLGSVVSSGGEGATPPWIE